MLKINEYFNGTVKSIGFDTVAGPVTAGVMEAGEYEFSTSKHETIIVTHGEMTVLLPDSDEWKTYTPYDRFEVPAGKSFKLKIPAPVAYLCYYKA